MRIFEDFNSVENGDHLTGSAKRRKLSHQTVSSSVETSAKPSRRTRSYSSSGKRDYFNVFGGEAEATSANLDPGAWNLPPSIQADFNQHQPADMFSDAQSTIPDNTLNMRLIAEQARSEACVTSNLPPDEVLQSSKSSLPWSEIIKAQREEGLLPEEVDEIRTVGEPVALPEMMENEHEEIFPIEEPVELPENPKTLDDGTYTPPGTPVPPSKTSQPITKRKVLSKKPSKTAKPKTKKRKKSNQKEEHQSEDELAMANHDLNAKSAHLPEVAQASTTSVTKTTSVIFTPHEDLQGTVDEPLHAVANLPISEVQVVINATKKTVTKHDEIVAQDLPAAGDDGSEKANNTKVASEITAVVEANIIKPQTKRGRGRPRKDQKAEDANAIVEPSSAQEKAEIKSVNDETQDKPHPLKEMPVNSTILEPPETHHDLKSQNVSETKLSIAENSENLPIESPAVKKPDLKTPSLLGGKRHRVGLSKRAHIAPLLRSVRK
jgi:hypothetical protein